jgi:hypothetical protein
MHKFTFVSRTLGTKNPSILEGTHRGRLKSCLSRLYDKVFWRGSRSELKSFVTLDQGPPRRYSCNESHSPLLLELYNDAGSVSESSTLQYDDAAHEARVSSEAEPLMKPLLG